MRTARSSSRPGGEEGGGGSPPGTSPGADPQTRHTPDQAPSPWDQASPRPHTPRPGTPHQWTEFLAHACENITLPQTSFAGR